MAKIFNKILMPRVHSRSRRGPLAHAKSMQFLIPAYAQRKRFMSYAAHTGVELRRLTAGFTVTLRSSQTFYTKIRQKPLKEYRTMLHTYLFMHEEQY